MFGSPDPGFHPGKEGCSPRISLSLGCKTNMLSFVGSSENEPDIALEPAMLSKAIL